MGLYELNRKKSTVFSKGTILSLVYQFMCVCVCFCFLSTTFFLQFPVELWLLCEKTKTTQLYYLGYHMTISVVKKKNKYLYFSLPEGARGAEMMWGCGQLGGGLTCEYTLH